MLTPFIFKMKNKQIKVKKEKLPKRMCFICGIDTDSYIVYQNGFVCDGCQGSTRFKELKNEAS